MASEDTEDNAVIVDNYGCLTIPTPKSDVNLKYDELERYPFSFINPSDNMWPCKGKVTKIVYALNDLFFILRCKKNEDGSRHLMLDGKNLNLTIGLIYFYLNARISNSIL